MKYRKPPKYNASTSDYHPAQVLGDRSPSEVELLSHFALYRGVPMTAHGIGVRINCRASNVLPILFRMYASQQIRPAALDGIPNETTLWVMD